MRQVFDGLTLEKGSMEEVYEVGGELGKGAFSVVRYGRHRQTGQQTKLLLERYLNDAVAIKIISATLFNANQRAQEAICAEVTAMKRIREDVESPCLILMLGIFSEKTRVSIILEELKGGELFDRVVARGRYTERDASQVLGKLANALNKCHQSGILHRDVKPENILYVSSYEDSEIKLIDFGLAMLEDGPSVIRKSNNLVGTPGYVAPEVLTSRLYGPSCDVWACGVITYILLAGYTPFFPHGDESLFEVIKKGKYYFHTGPWDQISPEAKDLVRGMLTVDIEKRATMTSILNHPWVKQSCDMPKQHLSDAITRLKAFNAKRKWRAVAAVVMVGAKFGIKRSLTKEGEECKKFGFSETELDILRSAFSASAEGGVLVREQLASVLSDIGFGPVPSDRMFDLFDQDGNGKVDYGEFLRGIASFKNTGDKALRFCFDVYDLDGVGAIKLQQLKSVLSCVMRTEHSSSGPTTKGSKGAIGNEKGATTTAMNKEVGKGHGEEEKLNELFRNLDLNCNGTIDFEEFKAGVKKEPLLVQAFLAPVQQGSLLATLSPSAVPEAQSSAGGIGYDSNEALDKNKNKKRRRGLDTPDEPLDENKKKNSNEKKIAIKMSSDSDDEDHKQ